MLRGKRKKDFNMLKNIIIAIVATASIGAASIGSAEARDGNRHHRNHSNIVIQFGGYGGGYGYYNNQFDRDYYTGLRSYGYGHHNRYAFDDFNSYCGTHRIKVKKWNNAHTRYKLVTKRVSDC